MTTSASAAVKCDGAFPDAPVRAGSDIIVRDGTGHCERKRRAALMTLLLIVLLACLDSHLLRAQQTATEEQAVRSRDDRERLAALQRDVRALEGLWSEHFTVNAPNNRVVVGRQANLDTFVKSGIINFSSFDRAIEFVRVDGDFATVMGMETVVARSDAPSAGLKVGQAVKRRFTNIWKKEAGTWRLYWRHANVITQ
jgi:ketosteroid isomerase-like protein